MGELLTFVVFAVAAIGLLWWGLWALLNPFEGTYNLTTGTKTGCAGCMAPMLLSLALGAAISAHRLAGEVTPGAWEVAVGLVTGALALVALLWRIHWGGVAPLLMRVERRLDEGFTAAALALPSRSSAAHVVCDAMACEPTVADQPPEPASYREAPPSRLPDLGPLRAAARKSARWRIASALGLALLTASPGWVLLLAHLGAAELESDALAALRYGAALVVPGALALGAIIQQVRRAAKGAVELLERRPEATPGFRADERMVPTGSGGAVLDAPQPLAAVGDPSKGYGAVDVGRGWRHSVEVMRALGWARPEESLWPLTAEASSSYGHSFTPQKILGPPRVYPAYGDRAGAWAPRPRVSDVEWLEATFASDAPPARAIRIFETCAAGATFAVTVREHGSSTEEVVFVRPPVGPMGAARVLEIPLDPPMRVGHVRAYVSNAANEWAEIDTIGLVANEPVPLDQRRRRTPPRWRTPLAVAALLVAGLAVGTLWLRSGSMPEAEPTASFGPGEARAWSASSAELAEVVWAARVVGVSSSHPRAEWHEHHALGPPDVWPAHGDVLGAWASERPDAGEEWIAIELDRPVRATAVVVVETFRPGALARVEATDGGEPVVLWQGSLPPVDESRMVRIELEEPRQLQRLRVVLDTSRAAGWNEIDAIGVVPAE